jgi:twinkle protein
MVSLAYRYGWKFGLFSSENMPYEYHFTKIAEKFAGKNWSDFTKGDIGRAKEWINEHFYWISIEAKVLSLEFLLEKYAELVVSHGLKGFVLDPWNQIEHIIPRGMNETQYVSKALSMVTTFVQRYDSHLWIVTHPTKPLKSRDGKAIRPKLADAAGSMNFANKAYNGFVVYRDFEFNTVEVEVAKVKFKFLGKHGIVPVQWNGDRGGQYWPLVPLEQKQMMIDNEPPF